MSERVNHGQDARGGGLWVVVPYKGPAGSKSRLSRLLREPERERLSLAMLDGVLAAALGSSRVARVVVMQPPHSPLPEQDDPRLEFVRESATGDAGPFALATDGLNQALVQAQAAVGAADALHLMILPSDLPLLSIEDVDALADAAESSSVVIAPDRESEGTNALVLSPPAAIVPAFGEQSFARHQRLGERAGLSVAVMKRLGLALDLDTPADVLRLYAIGEESRTAMLLRQMGVTPQVIASLGLAASATSGT
jgi:2-phospho-L-lactate guanylyltransferase